MLIKYFALITFVACGLARKLPDYIKPCQFDDPKFEECAVKNGNEAIPFLIKGDKRYRIRSHAPLIIPEVVLQASDQLTMKFINFELNLEGTKLMSFTLDPVKKTLGVKAGKDFDMKGDYELNGRILVLPVNGRGPFNATYENSIVEYSCNYELVDEDGEEYMRIFNGKVHATTTHATCFFGNLFNGNKQLGDQTNKFLNENWEELLAEFRPAVEEIMKKIIDTTVKAFLTTIPYKELFRLNS